MLRLLIIFSSPLDMNHMMSCVQSFTFLRHEKNLVTSNNVKLDKVQVFDIILWCNSPVVTYECNCMSLHRYKLRVEHCVTISLRGEAVVT